MSAAKSHHRPINNYEVDRSIQFMLAENLLSKTYKNYNQLESKYYNQLVNYNPDAIRKSAETSLKSYKNILEKGLKSAGKDRNQLEQKLEKYYCDLAGLNDYIETNEDIAAFTQFIKEGKIIEKEFKKNVIKFPYPGISKMFSISQKTLGKRKIRDLAQQTLKIFRLQEKISLLILKETRKKQILEHKYQYMHLLTRLYDKINKVGKFANPRK